MMKLLRLFLCLAVSAVLLWAEESDEAEKSAPAGKSAKVAGTIAGLTVAGADKRPVEFVAVALKQPDGTVVQSTVSDKQGRFTLEKVPAGDYTLVYNLVGTDGRATPSFRVDAQHPRIEFNALDVAADVLQLEKLEVKGKQQAFLNSIDRKTYNVGKEIQATTGSASDLLQNLPSVQVDIDGNISLRGSENVLVLINGRTSTLMGRTRAEALQQLPADSIEKIEVITNPSAKYKPDGTAGIINISLKKKHAAGLSGTVTGAYGNEDRVNAGVTAAYSSGPWALTGNVSVRQDDRIRRATDVRTSVDPATGTVSRVDKTTQEHARPVTTIGQAGAEYTVGESDKLGLTGSYNRRYFKRRSTDHNILHDAAGALTSEYDRNRYDPEFERSVEWGGSWQHTFPGEGHELNIEFKSSDTLEVEDNHYANVYRTPAIATTYDNKWIRGDETGTEVILEYKRPLGDDGKFETGYTRTVDGLDADVRGETLDPATGQWVKDLTTSNRFIIDSTIHAFYATYEQAFGKFGFLAGLRPELTDQKSRLVNTGQIVPNDYNRVYPSLHLAYQAGAGHEFQLNYSHRVRRPEIEDLNPFPEYQDPLNVRAGNPRLKPEDIHSIEAGYSFQQGDTNFTTTVYHRQTYNGFTIVTRDIGGGVLLTTHENLAVSRATGLETTLNSDLGKRLTLNFSSNVFFNTIDATNLGFSGTKSDVSWMAKLGGTLHLGKSTLLQFNTNYTSASLRPQGTRRPTFVANAGLRHELRRKNTALVLTVSDLFNSLKESTVLDTPALKETIVRRRSSRIVYLGFVYNFGKATKKSKDEQLKFDNSL